jgi:hypothetical protein
MVVTTTQRLLLYIAMTRIDIKTGDGESGQTDRWVGYGDASDCIYKIEWLIPSLP